MIPVWEWIHEPNSVTVLERGRNWYSVISQRGQQSSTMDLYDIGDALDWANAEVKHMKEFACTGHSRSA